MLGENLRKAPLIRVVIPFGAGIYTGAMLQSSISLIILILSLLALSIFIWISSKLSSSLNRRWIFGIVIIPALLLLGFIYQHICYTSAFSELPSGQNVLYRLHVEGHVKVTADWDVFYVHCMAERTDTCWRKTDVRLQLYSARNKDIPSFSAGEKIVVHAPLIRTPPPSNPGEFNYRRYLDMKGIWGSVYLKIPSSVLLIEEPGSFSIERLSFQLQDKFLSVFRKFEIKDNELALLSALTIGVRDEIDNEINKAFAASGAMHILSVSGLHVGIVYLVFARLLSLLGRSRPARILSVVMQICFLWFYAFLTGLSPAVNRAAAMFSFLALGKLMNRSASSLNIVSGSAFILLLVNPFLVFDMGFQLSYLAVISIILFQSFIYELLDFKNYFADQVWKLTALSLGAQVGTFPVSILYFHQFPNYFMLTNLLVVPLAAVILYISIGMMFLFWVPYLSSLLALLLKISLKGMIFFVMRIENLPYSVISDLSVNSIQVFILYLMIIFLACFIHFRRRNFLLMAAGLLAVFLCTVIVIQLNSYRNHFFIVFQQKGSSIMMAARGSSAIVLYSGKNLKLPRQSMKLAKGISIEKKIKTLQFHCIDSLQPGKTYFLNGSIEFLSGKGGKIIFLGNGNQRICWVRSFSADKIPALDSAGVDVIVLAGLQKFSDPERLKKSHCQQLVFDSSCREGLAKGKSLNFNGEKIFCHEVSFSGAFVFEK